MGASAEHEQGTAGGSCVWQRQHDALEAQQAAALSAAQSCAEKVVALREDRLLRSRALEQLRQENAELNEEHVSLRRRYQLEVLEQCMEVYRHNWQLREELWCPRVGNPGHSPLASTQGALWGKAGEALAMLVPVEPEVTELGRILRQDALKKHEQLLTQLVGLVARDSESTSMAELRKK